MPTTTLVIGGCRSGKSDHAQSLAEQSGDTRLYVATCVPQDAEMEQRIRRHRQARGGGWDTHEEPLRLSEAVSRKQSRYDVILIDCLTLWTSNVLAANPDGGDAHLDAVLDRLVEALSRPGCDLVLVSNEVGTGIVPEHPLARRFRDMAGRVNQRIAASVETVIWMVAGIPVKIKG